MTHVIRFGPWKPDRLAEVRRDGVLHASCVRLLPCRIPLVRSVFARAAAMTEAPREICLHVCITCRPAGGPDERELRPGAILYRALARRSRTPTHRRCGWRRSSASRSASGPARSRSPVRDAGPTSTATSTRTLSVETILDGLRRYAATSDGLVPWRERPEAFRKGVVARIPPFNATHRSRQHANHGSPHERPVEDPLHHRHRLPRRGQDDPRAPPPRERGRAPPRGRSSTSSAISASTAPSSRAAASRAAPRRTSSNCRTAASAAPSPTISSRPSTSCSTGRTPPEHILIETSGLALPKPLVNAFNWPAIRSRVTVDGVSPWSTARPSPAGAFADDPQALAAQRAADAAVEHDNPLEEVFEDQLLCADLIMLNKTDQMGTATGGAFWPRSRSSCRAP